MPCHESGTCACRLSLERRQRDNMYVCQSRFECQRNSGQCDGRGRHHRLLALRPDLVIGGILAPVHCNARARESALAPGGSTSRRRRQPRSSQWPQPILQLRAGRAAGAGRQLAAPRLARLQGTTQSGVDDRKDVSLMGRLDA